MVDSVKTRAGIRKIAIDYQGIKGHLVQEAFVGTLPPQPNVRIYRIVWMDGQVGPEAQGNPGDSPTTNQSDPLIPSVTNTECDLDLEPIPTVKSIGSEFVPCVIAVYRELIRDYADCGYDQRNKIWHRLMSAMKFSLAAVREAYTRRRRRRPMKSKRELQKAENAMEDEEASDARAIKKAIRLVVEGCASKATKVLDQEVIERKLSDEETIAKLKTLHPYSERTFHLPADAPALAILSTQELREAGRRLAKGAAPGPSGTTDGIVRILLDDEVCCSALCHMLLDVINGKVADEVMTRLKRARLVAIPKADGGIRPVAVGEMFLKLAEVVMLQKYERSLGTLFAPWQYGVSQKSGCESIVHQLQESYMKGEKILSIDLCNAFNSPYRDHIADSLYSYATLRPFQRLFHAQYSKPSELLFYGKDGTLHGTVSSSRGVRQGSPLSSFLFCTFMQPMLATLALEYPTLKIFAYIDDINLVSDDADLLTKAFYRLWDLLGERDVQLANRKCVWFGGREGREIPETLKMAGVNSESDALKALGAYIGENERVSNLLLRNLRKHKTIFRRLRRMGANNVSCLILSKCVNVRQRYQIRTHAPEASGEMAKEFDSEVEDVLKAWLGPLTSDQVEWARLPLSMGGLGLSSTDSIRVAAYEASQHAALEQQKKFSAQVATCDASTVAAVPEEESAEKAVHKAIKTRLCETKKTAQIMQATTRKGSYSWLHATERFIPTRQYTLAVMPRLGICHPELPSSFLCPGCKTEINGETALTHVPGCVRCTGTNSTTKHNCLIRYIYDLCMKAGIPCEREPRQFSSYTCLGCSEVISEERKREHATACKGSALHRSGPDLVVYWATGEIFYDLTVVHELAPSILGTKPAKALQDAITRKRTKYVATKILREDNFRCLPILASGSLHANTRELLHILAEKSSMNPQAVERDFALHLQELNGAVLNCQLRRFLEPRTEEDTYGF